MNLPIIVLGAGGHARVLIDALVLSGRTVAGIADSNPSLAGKSIMGFPVIGNDEAVLRHPPATVELANGLGSVQSTEARERLFRKFKEHGYNFARVIHPAAVVAADVELAEGVQIMAGAVVQTGSSLGVNAIVNTRAAIDHDCRLGNHVHVAPGATLSGSVELGDNVHVGTAAAIIQGIRVGHASVIAAGAVVVKDVPAGVMIRGVPGKAATL